MSSGFGLMDAFPRLTTFRSVARWQVLQALLCFTLCTQAYPWTRIKVDLSRDLCTADLQQRENNPASGVDFISENEVVVYTVCNVGPQALLRRADPSLQSPNHLKAVIVELPSGTVKQRYDWPTRGRGTMLRATHDGDLLRVRDHRVDLLDLQGNVLRGMEFTAAGTPDFIFVGLSPALDTIAVTQSSQRPDRTTVNGVAILDSRTLEVLARWNDNGDSWVFGASRNVAVRTSNHESDLDVREIKDGKLAEGEWKLVTHERGIAVGRPLFLDNDYFIVSSGLGVQKFNASGEFRGGIHCYGGAKAAVSRDGKVTATACAALPKSYSDPTPFDVVFARFSDFPQQDKRWKTIHESVHADFDVALSPTGSSLAIMDGLRLTVEMGK